jgi:hypothetical protein
MSDGAGRTAGGDPVCWLDRVCPECGAFRERPSTPDCARCGTPFPSDAPGAPDTPDAPDGGS